MPEIISLIADFASIGSLIVAIFVHWRIVSRDRKRETIAEFNKIRDKYPNINFSSSYDEKLAYLKELERFCVGVNQGIYDLDILAKMSRSLLVSQFAYMKNLVKERREDLEQESAYSEYIIVMNKLESKKVSK